MISCNSINRLKKAESLYFNLIALPREQSQNKRNGIMLSISYRMQCVFLVCAMRMKEAMEHVMWYERHYFINNTILVSVILSVFLTWSHFFFKTERELLFGYLDCKLMLTFVQYCVWPNLITKWAYTNSIKQFDISVWSNISRQVGLCGNLRMTF